MQDESANPTVVDATAGRPLIVDQATWQAELDALRVQEKAYGREGDAIAAARRRLPMVEVDPTITLIGPHGQITLLQACNRSGGRRAGLKDALVLQGMLHPWRATSWIRRSTRDAMR
jgi:predicted dithiol-disulfide oxidoreductase (DUF899 family)